MAAAAVAAPVDDGRLRAAIAALLPSLGDTETVGQFKHRMAVHLELPETGLDAQADQVKALCQEAINAGQGPRTPAQYMKDLVTSLGRRTAPRGSACTW